MRGAIVPDSDADTTTYTVTGGELTNGQTYDFQVRAVNGAVGGDGPHAGAGPASEAVTATPALPGPGVTVSARALSVPESGSATYTLVLGTAPTADVTVTVAAADGGDADLTVSPSSLTFTTADWNTAQTVTVSAAADDGDTTNGETTFEHRATSADSAYNGIAIASVVATEADDDDVIPGQPTGLVAVPGDGQVALSWDALGESFVTKWQYRIKSPGKANYHAWRDVPDSDADTTTYTVTGGELTNGQTYDFQVRAVNGAVGGDGPHAGAGPASEAVRATVGELRPEILGGGRGGRTRARARRSRSRSPWTAPSPTPSTW